MKRKRKADSTVEKETDTAICLFPAHYIPSAKAKGMVTFRYVPGPKDVVLGFTKTDAPGVFSAC